MRRKSGAPSELSDDGKGENLDGTNDLREMTAREMEVLVGGSSSDILEVLPLPTVKTPDNLPAIDEDEEVFQFDSHYLETGRDGRGSYPDLINVPIVPRSNDEFSATATVYSPGTPL
jgi:hypothetical protein